MRLIGMSNQTALSAFPSDDRYFRFHFADTHRMAGLLREFLPQDLVETLVFPASATSSTP